MNAGIAFVTTDTIKCYIRCRESGANDNVNRQPINVKVYNTDGTTLRATLKDTAHIGPNTTEENSSTLTNEALADDDALAANYTTEAGDYLVIEVGQQVSSAGGIGVTATMEFGTNSGSDLAEDSASQNQYCPWFYISRTVTFRNVPEVNKPLLGILSNVGIMQARRLSGAMIGLKSVIRKGFGREIKKAFGLLSTIVQLFTVASKQYVFTYKPLLGVLLRNTRGMSKSAIKTLLGVVSKRTKGAIKYISAFNGIKSTISKKPNKVIKTLLGVTSTRRKGMTTSVKTLLGLLSKRRFGLSKRSIKPLLGIISSTKKGFSTKVRPLLGLLPTRKKGSSTTVKPLLGLRSLMKKGTRAFISTLLGLRSLRRIGITKYITTLLGVLSKRTLLLTNVYVLEFISTIGMLPIIRYPLYMALIALKGMTSFINRRVDWHRTPRKGDP
jgi:hypothetical protein